jgi:sigma-E factor negative regulatory protein RseB
MPARGKPPLRRRILICAAAASGWQVPTLALAGRGEPAALALPDAGDVRAWLMRVHTAASQQSFQGTFVVSAAGSVSSARIAHFCVGADQFERIESLDGLARQVLRHNDTVYTFWPGARAVLIEQRDQVVTFPALLQAGDTRIDAFYEMRGQGMERMAGREAVVLQLRARDRLRFGLRLCADQATGLLLRVDVLGDQGEVLESSAFSDVTIGVRPQPNTVLQAIKKLEGYRVLRPSLTPTRLEAQGWSLNQGVPGFEKVSCVRRPLGSLPGDDREPAVEVLQAIYSDGLTHVSLFIEPYAAARHRRPVLTAVGATHTLMRRQGDWWVTAVGDVPGATLREFAAALEYKKP